MPRLLTVDDSRAIRTIVTKFAAELGLEVDEAEDGEQGLAKLEECQFDLILLDVTMPVLDGPGMLAKLRERGDQTPVIMLTSESKRSIVAGAMKLGIQDYILKPFKAEELRAKVNKVLNLDGTAGEAEAVAPPAARAPEARAAAPLPPGEVTASSAARQFIDILVIDDMENVAKKLRTLVPPHVTSNAVSTAQSALNQCRERVYRVVLLDLDIPDVNSLALLNQLRMLQPHAAFLALTLRTAGDAQKDALQGGFDDVLFKPFDKESIDDLLMRYFDNQELLVTEDNVLRVGPFTGREDKMDRYFSRLAQLLDGAVEKVAAACFDEAVIDVSQIPLRPERTPRLLLEAQRSCKKTGLDLRVIATAEGQKLLSSFSETSKLTVSVARG